MALAIISALAVHCGFWRFQCSHCLDCILSCPCFVPGHVYPKVYGSDFRSVPLVAELGDKLVPWTQDDTDVGSLMNAQNVALTPSSWKICKACRTSYTL